MFIVRSPKYITGGVSKVRVLHNQPAVSLMEGLLATQEWLNKLGSECVPLGEDPSARSLRLSKSTA